MFTHIHNCQNNFFFLINCQNIHLYQLYFSCYALQEFSIAHPAYKKLQIKYSRSLYFLLFLLHLIKNQFIKYRFRRLFDKLFWFFFFYNTHILEYYNKIHLENCQCIALYCYIELILFLYVTQSTLSYLFTIFKFRLKIFIFFKNCYYCQ